MDFIRREIFQIKESYETELQLQIEFLELRQRVGHSKASPDINMCVQLLKEIRSFHKQQFEKLQNFEKEITENASNLETKSTQTENFALPNKDAEEAFQCPQCTILEKEKIRLNCDRMDAVKQLKSQSKLFEDLQRDFLICKREFLRQTEVFKNQEKKYKSKTATLSQELQKTK